jgi:signal transduction histidine kinase
MVVGAVVLQVVRVFEQHYLSVETQSLASELTDFQNYEQTRPPQFGVFENAETYLRYHTPLPGHVIIIAFKGHPALGSDGSKKIFTTAEVRSIIAHPQGVSRAFRVTISESSYLVLSAPLINDGVTVGHYFGFDSLKSFVVQQRQVIVLTIFEGVVTLLFAILSGYILLRRVMSTVGDVTKTALQIAGGDLDQRLPQSKTSDELSELTDAFNRMISKLQGTLAAERQLLADVSHQLRTPLTVLRGNVELMEVSPPSTPEEVDETVGILLEEIEFMSSLVDRLLYLERLSLPQYLSKEAIDVRSFLYDLYTAARVLGERTWTMGEVPDLVIRVDQASIRGALLNLIDNAFKATSEGEVIEIGARLDATSHWVELYVRDEGRGVPPEMLDRIFQRFETSGALTSRGAGLGLAIVKATAEAHGGEARMESELGKRTTVVISVPYVDGRSEGDGDREAEDILGEDDAGDVMRGEGFGDVDPSAERHTVVPRGLDSREGAR